MTVKHSYDQKKNMKMPQLIKNTQKTAEFINGRHAKESIDRKYENIVHNLNYFMTSLIVWKLSHFFIRDTLSFCFPNSKYLLRSKPSISHLSCVSLVEIFKDKDLKPFCGKYVPM